MFKLYEHRGHVLLQLRYGYTSSACSNSAQDFSVPPQRSFDFKKREQRRV